MYTNHDNAVLRARLTAMLAVLSLATAAAWGDGNVAAWGYNGYGQCAVPAPNDEIVAVAAGYLHNVALKLDGSIVAWGDNECGQCEVPAPNTGFIAVAAGGYHSLALKADGSIVAWGTNTYHQCDVPAPNSDFIAIAAGYQHSLGLKSDGRIIAWGDNALGQCNLPANTTFVALAAGFYHSLGLKADGSIAAWGDRRYGQCALPSPNSGFAAVAAGESDSLGLKADGTIVAWGDNGQGQCAVPAPNSGFVAVAAGQAHSLALRADGTVAAWGWNSYGQCNVPEPNARGVAIAAGGFHSLAVQVSIAPSAPLSPSPADAASSVVVQGGLRWSKSFWADSYNVYFGTTNPPPLLGTALSNCWLLPPLACATTYYWQIASRNCSGTNSAPIWTFSTRDLPPELPAYTSPPNGGTDIPVDAVLTWTAAGAASYDVYFGPTNPPALVGTTGTPHWTLALDGACTWYWQVVAKNDCGATPGPVWSFTTPVSSPTIRAWGYNFSGQCDVPAPNMDFVALAAGAAHGLAVRANGSIAAWGLNNYGQCDVPPPNGEFVAVAGGALHSLGLKADGSIAAWGRNSYGESNTPIPNGGFTAIAAGYYHSLGLKLDGTIAAWGSNSSHQCDVPAPNSGFIAVTAGTFHSLGLKAEGSIVAWGNNTYGQCTVPAPNTGFVAIAAGEFHNLGLKADGSIVAWGRNDYGQCNVPAPDTGFVGVAAGGFHSMGLKTEGSIVAWGFNTSGQCNPPAHNSGFVAVACNGSFSLGLQSGGTAPARIDAPNPADGASNIAGRTIIDWPDVSWATSYDVYFGTTNPPPRVGATPGSLRAIPPVTCGTTYYWQVVASNCNGTTSGPVWSFSAPEGPPGLPTDPTPPNAGTDVAANAALTWIATGAGLYDVYFGLTNPPPFVGTTRTPSWTPPMDNGLRWYWQVVARNECGTTAGPVWSFTTPVVAPSMRVWGDSGHGACNVPAPNVDFVAMAAGEDHVLGLKANGTIVAWGSNTYHQCDVPAPNTGFITVAAGDFHSLGVKADGSIVAFGSGVGILPTPNTDFVAVAGGSSYSLGLKTNGSIVAWGSNNYGQCNIPAPNSGFVAVAAGYGHALGLKADGSIVAWGNNQDGRCNVPAPNGGFVAVAAGVAHSLGLRADGSIVAWGGNSSGQCSVPLPNADFVAVAAGFEHSLGLKADGSIVPWGSNYNGPCVVPWPNGGFVALAAGGWHSLGLKSGGALPQFGLPSPADGANGVSVTAASLRWSSSGLATNCDVYFGTTNPPPLLGSTRLSRWTPPPFACETTYYWQVVGHNCNGTTFGPIWTFSTTDHPPEPPAGPSPSDGATNVAPDTALGWTVSEGATSYDVYLGETNPPPFLGTTEASGLTLPPLVCRTTYYWQVVPRNCTGTTPGPVWSFSTTTGSPELPASPTPSDGATNVATNAVLEWAAAGQATSYDVYFGTTNPPPLKVTTSTTSWSPPGLALSRMYYWRVAPRNGCGTTLGPVWSFRTPPLMRRGDLNCDGVVSFADINPFVLALQGESAYEAACPLCRWLNADINGDGVVSFADINPFVNCLYSGCP